MKAVLDHLFYPFHPQLVEYFQTNLCHTACSQCLFILIDKINKSTFQEICSAVNVLDI